MIRAFIVWGTLILAALGYETYRGASLARYDEIRNVPKSIRDNPGAYRSVYSRVPHK
jgi:hypothetical protein